jgi:hypothetical protein
MNYSPIERIAARLPEAPFFINNMSFPIVVNNVWEALKKYKFYVTKTHFKVFTVVDYSIKLGCVNQVHNVVLSQETNAIAVETIQQPNQVVFVADPDENGATATTLTSDTELDQIARVTPHIIGSYVDFIEDGDCLKFKDTDINVGVEYTELLVDADTGYPLLPEDAEMLVTWYCAHQHFAGEFMAGRLDGQRMQWVEAKLEQARKDAFSIIRMSQNELDKIGNVLSSFDRKTFGVTT